MRRVILMFILLGGCSAIFAETPKDKVTVTDKQFKDYMELYDEYVNASNALYSDIQKRPNGILYQGIWQERFEYVESLYEECLKESKKGPYITPPSAPKVCWLCMCTSYFCGKLLNPFCGYGPMCPTLCPWCGYSVLKWTNGTVCSYSAMCPGPTFAPVFVGKVYVGDVITK